MYFKRNKDAVCLVTFVFLFLLFTLSNSVNAQQVTTSSTTQLADVMFSAKPGNCVTLRQGRTCFANVSLSWQTPEKGDFCIYQKLGQRVIQCWKNSRRNQVKFEFESAEKVAYQLISISDNQIIAETTINVSWVHKASPRKRRWRLF